jgi:tRNA A37 threonylcarbamoyladenosine synthetase subunit TsaC/SUA5/YrdC
MGAKKVMDISPEKVREDAEAVFDVIMGGGIAIVPLDVAYAIIGHKEDAIKKIFAVKNRSFEKPSGMFACMDHSLTLHDLGAKERAIQEALFHEYDLPFSVVAPFDPGHSALAGVDPYVIETSSKAGTLDMLLNAGAFHNTLSQLCFDRGKPAFGSSANISLTGSKFNVADIEPELIQVADIVIDHGTSKYANPEGVSSSIIDFRDFTVVRYGCCFDQLEKIFRERFSIELRPAE